MHAGDVHVPVCVHQKRLLEAPSLSGRLSAPVPDDAEAAEDPVRSRRSHVDDVRVQHHVRAASVALLEVLLVELDDETAFPVLKPVGVRGVPGVAVRRAHASPPVVVALAGDADKGAKPADGHARPSAPPFDEADYLVTEAILHPAL